MSRDTYLKLKPPVNLRHRDICTCYTCQWGKFDDEGCFICLRDPENVGFDVGTGDYITSVCDRYKRLSAKDEAVK
jgi:hypothetical protein